jgi:hypothetical protein
MPKLDVFVAPEPWPVFCRVMDVVNRWIMLKGMLVLRDVPGLRRIPGIRGLADVRAILVSDAETATLKALCADGGATFLLPNHPEFFTDWMLDKEMISRVAPEAASWATNGVVNGMGRAMQKFFLWNNLIAQIPGNSEAARAHSVRWALRGKGVLLHPEGGVGWHADFIAPLMPGAAAMALDAKAKAPERAVRLAPMVWKLVFPEDATAGLIKECAYVESSLNLGKGQGANPAERVHSIFHKLFDREAEKLSLVAMADVPLRAKRDALEAGAVMQLEHWLGDGVSGRDAAVTIQQVKRKARADGKQLSPEAKAAQKLADRLALIRRLGDFAFEKPTITQEDVAEHLKRLRNDLCKGTWRDAANKFIPQPVARRHAHVRLLEPVEVHGGEDPAHLMGLVRHAMQAALDDINAGLEIAGRVSWANPFYRPVS